VAVGPSADGGLPVAGEGAVGRPSRDGCEDGGCPALDDAEDGLGWAVAIRGCRLRWDDEGFGSPDVAEDRYGCWRACNANGYGRGNRYFHNLLIRNRNVEHSFRGKVESRRLDEDGVVS
jgi:hypothetical protein